MARSKVQTTICIDSELFRDAKAASKICYRTLSNICEEGLRRELARIEIMVKAVSAAEQEGVLVDL